MPVFLPRRLTVFLISFAVETDYPVGTNTSRKTLGKSVLSGIRIVDIEGQMQARPAPRLDGKGPADPGAPSVRGEHTAEILASLGVE